MRIRIVPVPAYHYLTLVAQEYERQTGVPVLPPHGVRCTFITLYKHAVGVKVQAWFWRHNPRKIPELRIGINFDRNDPQLNAQAGEAFAARHAQALAALGAELWPSETHLDRRYMTRIEVPPVGEDLSEVVTRAADLARKYVDLLGKRDGA